MEVWCRSRIPVEGNFGQTYDSLNQSIRGLEGEFSATINLKVGEGQCEGGGRWRMGGGHREQGVRKNKGAGTGGRWLAVRDGEETRSGAGTG